MLSGYISLIPKSLVLSQTLLCFFPNDNTFAKNWDMWSDRAEYLMFGLSWKPGLWLYTPPHLLHISRSAGLQLLAPLLPCFPGFIEGKLEEAQSPYTSFFLLMKGSLSQPVGGEAAGPLLPWY